MKVLTLVGTRPELIKLSLVIKELDQQTTHILAHTGQNFDYELNQIFFEDLGIRKPNYFLNCAKGSAIETIAAVLVETEKLVLKEKPDAALLYGDTNSCMSAIVFKKHRIPLFHMEAGNRCFDQRVPEEINRKVVDHLSDINMPLTEHGRRYLLAEGIRPETVLKTGSCMKEILTHYAEKIKASQVLKDLKLSEKNYFVISAHREENVDREDRLKEFMSFVSTLAQTHKVPVIVSVHPRTQKRLDQAGFKNANPLVQLMKPLGFSDYVKLQMNARCVISDSGTLMEESSIMGFPAVLARDAHERPEGMDAGAAVVCTMDSEKLLSTVATVVKQHQEFGRGAIVPDYNVDQVSKTVVRIILSYKDYIRRTVWYQEPI